MVSQVTYRELQRAEANYHRLGISLPTWGLLRPCGACNDRAGARLTENSEIVEKCGEFAADHAFPKFSIIDDNIRQFSGVLSF